MFYGGERDFSLLNWILGKARVRTGKDGMTPGKFIVEGELKEIYSAVHGEWP